MADDLLAAYPKTIRLNDGTAVRLRILIPQDRAELGHMIIGSVAEKLTRYAPCAVMVLRPQR